MNMDEWGEYNVQKCDIFEIRQEDGEIMEAIGNNNSAVTGIRVNGWENIYDIDESNSLLNGWNKEYYDDNGDLIAYVFDWERAGKTVGDSKYLRHLELRLGIFDPTQNVILFCRGLALNTSIESLVIDCHRYYRLNERESEEILSLTAQLFRELTLSIRSDLPSDRAATESLRSCVTPAAGLSSP